MHIISILIMLNEQRKQILEDRKKVLIDQLKIMDLSRRYDKIFWFTKRNT